MIMLESNIWYVIYIFLSLGYTYQNRREFIYTHFKQLRNIKQIGEVYKMV